MDCIISTEDIITLNVGITNNKKKTFKKNFCWNISSRKFIETLTHCKNKTKKKLINLFSIAISTL